jgi:transposase
MRST